MSERPPRLSYSARLVLAAMHRADRPVWCNDVATTMRLDSVTVLRTHQQLERDGYVRRVAAPEGAQTSGRPRNYYELTEAGHELAAATLPEVRRQAAAVAEGLGLTLAPKGFSLGPGL
jgi:DNA-binding MarR family transcriptional regulator